MGAARIGVPCQGVQGYRATGFEGKYQPLRFVDSGASRMEIWTGKSGQNGTGTRKLEVKAMSWVLNLDLLTDSTEGWSSWWGQV